MVSEKRIYANKCGEIPHFMCFSNSGKWQLIKKFFILHEVFKMANEFCFSLLIETTEKPLYKWKNYVIELSVFKEKSQQNLNLDDKKLHFILFTDTAFFFSDI